MNDFQLVCDGTRTIGPAIGSLGSQKEPPSRRRFLPCVRWHSHHWVLGLYRHHLLRLFPLENMAPCSFQRTTTAVVLPFQLFSLDNIYHDPNCSNPSPLARFSVARILWLPSILHLLSSSFWLNQISKKKIDLFTLSFSTTLHNLFPSFQLLALYFFSLLLLKAVALYLHGSVMTTNHSQFFSSIHAQVTFSHRYIHIVHGFLAVPTFLFSFYFKYLTCITWTTALSLSPCCKITLEHDFRNK